jgi:hypothetical protein
MRVAQCLNGNLLLLAAAGLALASPASADDHDKKSGNSRVPSYFAYPRGRSLAQYYTQPSAGIGSLAAFNSSPGSVSPSASMSVLYQQPATRKLVARECLLLPQSSSQIRLGSAQAGLVGGPQIIHKFGYGLQYKEIPLSRLTSQGLVIASRGNQRKVLFSRDRNLPDPDQLPADTQPTIKQEDATQLGRDDAKEAIGGVDFDVAAGAANEAPHLEIVVGEKGKGELAWTYVVRSKDRKNRFASQYWVAAQGAARILLIVQLKAKFNGDEKKAYGAVKELTLGAAALNPRDVPDAVRLVFVVDHQNDAKFFGEMAKAADAHGIPRPANPEDLNNPANLNLATK